MEREGKKIRLKMLKLPVTEAQRRLRTTWGLPVFMPPSGGPGLVSPGNSLPEVTHSCEGQQHNQRAHHIGPENKQLGLCPTALVAMKTHLAKIYLFDQEYKSHFRNMCSYKLKHDNVIFTMFLIVVLLGSVSGCHPSRCRSSPQIILWSFHQGRASGGYAPGSKDATSSTLSFSLELPAQNLKIAIEATDL